jgi:hypothetical protein
VSIRVAPLHLLLLLLLLFSGFVTNIQSGLKKLRALGSEHPLFKQTVVLWRGMSYMQLPQKFNAGGGTQLAPMSTTTDVSVAISYAVKKDTRSALLIRLKQPGARG